MHARSVVMLAGSLTVLGAISGCGESDPLGRKAISGTVSFNGAPVEKGNIAFQPVDKSTTSGGSSIQTGKYSVPQKTGLPVGKYRVSIHAPKPGTGGQGAADAPPGDPPAPPQELIPPEWNTNSEQYIEVNDKGPYVYNFDIKPKGK
jgi:hypothetical protein